MKVIDVHHLEVWSGFPESKAEIAKVLSRLIRTTSPELTMLQIPKGKSTYRGGWDGIVISQAATEFVPEGVSLWEFGTEKDAQIKAEKDYVKRTNDPLGYMPSECTLVIVTTRVWEKSEIWKKNKLSTGIWKDIQIIEANILVEWLMLAPLQSLEIARAIGIDLHPSIEGAESHYNVWSLGPQNMRIRPEMILAGREKQCSEIIDMLESGNEVIGVSSNSKEEIIPFICAMLLGTEHQVREKLLSGCLIVNELSDFKMLMVYSSPLLLIPRFIDLGLFRTAISNGHKVILPLSPIEKIQNLSPMILPKIDRDKIIEELGLLGMNEYKARAFSKETGRNITIIRRRLGFDGNKPKWSSPEQIELLLPALLIGKWSEDVEGDRFIVECITKEPYEQYSARLERWLNEPDSPLIRISGRWRLISPTDVWNQIGSYLTKGHLERFAEAFLLVMSEVKPSLSLPPEHRYMANFLAKPTEFTEFLRKGLCESMILFSIYGDELGIVLNISAQQWVDRHMDLLLSNMDIQLWKSFDQFMPLIAEAAPERFLESLEVFIGKKAAEFENIFEEAPSPIFSGHYHTGILWGLEKLAWLPGYLTRVTNILLEMDKLDPGLKIYNRPINSLADIFLGWHPQTDATLQERKDVIGGIAKRKPQLAWKFCERLFKLDTHTSGTVRPKWRHYDPAAELYDDKDVYGFIEFLYTTAFLLSRGFPSRLAFLIGKIEEVVQGDKMKLFEYLISEKSKIKDPDFEIYRALRKLMCRINTYLRTEQLLTKEEIEIAKRTYDAYFPTDLTSSWLWIFESEYIEFPEGRPKDLEHLEMFEYLRERKKEALEKIYHDNSFSDFLGLIQKVDPRPFGQTLAYLDLNGDETLSVCQLLNSEVSKEVTAVKDYLYTCFFHRGSSFCMEMYEIVKPNLDEKTRGSMLAAFPADPVIWSYIEGEPQLTVDTYWKSCKVGFTNVTVDTEQFQFSKFTAYQRYFSALQMLENDTDNKPTEIISEALINVCTLPAEDIIELDIQLVEELISILQKRSDANETELAKIEWNCMTILSNAYRVGAPLILHKELSINPSFFVEILCWASMPDDEHDFESAFEGENLKFAAKRGMHAQNLLKSWKQIPGVSFDADKVPVLNAEVLEKWVKSVLELSAQHNRLAKAHLKIGKMLAGYPEVGKTWPPGPIAEMIDSINSKDLNQGFCVAVFNKRSFSSRMPYDGGQRERSLASYFRNFAVQHQYLYPVTAGLLEYIAQDYECSAGKEDRQANESDLDD